MSVAAELANCQQRIKELEARMRRLEAALAAVQQPRRDPPQKRAMAREDAFILEDDLVALAAGGEPLLADSTPDAGARQPLAVTPPRAAAQEQTAAKAASAGVELSFTDSFSTLEDRLQEQLDLEARAAPANAADTAGHPVLIDAGLIDKAFAKPPPELIHVVSDFEEQYAHLAEKVVSIWGTPECVAFLRKLIVDERGSRQGFPFEVMSELLILSAVAETPAVSRAWETEAGVAKKSAQAPN